MPSALSQISFYSLGIILVRICVATALISAFFVLIQDFLIFPRLLDSKIANTRNYPPAEIDEFTIQSHDGQELPVWRAAVDPTQERGVALLFHGNGDSISSFIGVQAWLQSLGIASYSVEYRGYNGRDSGWPSEQKFYDDADAAISLISAQRNGVPKNLIVLGSSIGTGVASYVAEKYAPKVLVLLSPYTNLREVVRATLFFGFLSPFVKYSFPTIERMGKLKSTAVIIAHGKQDNTIPWPHSAELERSYRGTGKLKVLLSEDAGHNDLLAKLHPQIAEAIIGGLQP